MPYWWSGIIEKKLTRFHYIYHAINPLLKKLQIISTRQFQVGRNLLKQIVDFCSRSLEVGWALFLYWFVSRPAKNYYSSVLIYEHHVCFTHLGDLPSLKALTGSVWIVHNLRRGAILETETFIKSSHLASTSLLTCQRMFIKWLRYDGKQTNKTML